MKKDILSVLFLTCLLTGCGHSPLHESDRIISPSQLPAPAQTFLQQHFAGIDVKQVVCEKRASLSQYEVELKKGIDLQFDRNGACTEVRCKKCAVPDGIIPAEIDRQIKEQFPDRFVIKYEHDSRIYDIDLDDDTELTFNRAMRLIDVDHP